VAVLLVILIGHSQAQHMVVTQPMKMAAAEALWESEDPASFSLLTIGDETNRRDVWAIRIPNLLSLMAYNRLDGEVKGILNLQQEYEATYGPGDYVPPIAISYWTFRIMVGTGFLMLGIALYSLLHVMQGKNLGAIKFLNLFPFAIALPYMANTTGWMLTEMGRQPWIVFGLLKTEEAYSTSLTPGMVLSTLVIFTLLYGVLMVADVYLLRKFAVAGPETVHPTSKKQKRMRTTEEESYWE